MKLYGEKEAKARAIAQRQKWPLDLPPTFLVFDAEAVAASQFGGQLDQPIDGLPGLVMSDTEIAKVLEQINRYFDGRQPRRSRRDILSYAVDAPSPQDTF